MTDNGQELYSRLVMKGLQHATAFVVQFRDAPDDGVNPLQGRVEHVASGRTTTFKSIDELPQLLRKLLRAVRMEPKDLDGSE